MKNVLIIDSGSGGINVLSQCIKFCPSNNYLLFLDQKNLPYGEKGEIELQNIAIDIVKNIDVFFHPEIVIIGCNTLTSVAIDSLRDMFKNKIFIGSEPAIKPALEKYKKEEVLILATSVTINNCKLLKDKKSICKSQNALPKIIDENLFNRKKIEKYLRENLKVENKKAIVLGCTHFEAVREELKNVFGELEFFGSVEGIAKRLKDFCDDDKSYQVQLMSSGDHKRLVYFYEYLKTLLQKVMTKD